MRQTTLEAYAHQEVPFERLVEELAPARTLAHAPLVQVMFELQNAPATRVDVRDLRFRVQPLDTRVAKFDLTLLVEEDPGEGRLSAILEYRKDLFDAPTIERMAEHWAALLKAADRLARNAGRRAHPRDTNGVRPNRRADKRRDTQRGAHDSARGLPNSRTLSRSSMSPQSGLCRPDQASDRLARRLRKLGIRRGHVVAVCLPRCAWQLVTFVAAMKAGAAYLPLDIEYPKERLLQTLRDSAARVLVAWEDYRG